MRHLIVDLDGVIFRGRSPIRGASGFFRTARQLGLPLIVLTNQSAPTRREYLRRFERIGVDLRPSQIICGAEMAAMKVGEIARPGARVLAVGESGLREALRRNGFRLVASQAEVVVVGLDRRFSYSKLAVAAREVRRGALFVGTTPDAIIPSAGAPVPGGGPLIAAVAVAAGVEPVVVGKPSPEAVEIALARLAATAERTAIVGDGLDTDMAVGWKTGLITVLVLTGGTSRAQAAAAVKLPDFVYASLEEFGRALARSRSAAAAAARK